MRLEDVPIQIDRSEPNVVRVSFASDEVSDEEVAAYLADSEESLQQRTDPFVIVVHTGARLTVPQRKMQGDFMIRVAPIIRNLCRGYAFVVDGAIPRGILTAILWRAPPPCDSKVFGRPDEALAWARRQLREPAIPQ